MVDRIPEDTVEFHIRGYTVAVENAALGQAIACLLYTSRNAVSVRSLADARIRKH